MMTISSIRRSVYDLEDVFRHRIMLKNEKTEANNPVRLAISKLYPLSREQKAQIDDLYVKNYGEHIDYIWHQNYAAHSGLFDCNYFPELLYIPEFEAFQNQNKHANEMIEDKNHLPLIAKAVGVKMPRTIVSCTNGILRDDEYHIISPLMALDIVRSNVKCFVKPSVDTCSGNGCEIIKEGDRIIFTRNSLIINDKVYSRNFVIQELVTCHDSITALYPGSVNTYRIITYYWKGLIETMPIIMRIGQGGHFLDNAHQGGMFCAVNIDGTVGAFATTEFNAHYQEHPDTHTVFATHRLKFVDRILSSAKHMHETMPQIGVVNWDFTVDQYGDPVLIEANCRGGGIWLPQMAHGIGPFGERTAEVLQWLRFMKRLKLHERENFMGGWYD